MRLFMFIHTNLKHSKKRIISIYMLTVHLFCDSRRYINSSSSSSISKNVDSQDVAMWLVVVVVVGGLAAGQLGLLVTSSSLAWPGLAAWTLTDPSRDNFHQKSSAADHLTTAAREQRGSFMSSGRILQLSL